jgi:hypothetical protein
MKNRTLFLVVACCLAMFGTMAHAGTKTSVATGDWATGATWNVGTAPAVTDSVIIAGGFTVTIAANAQCGAIRIESGSTLTISASLTTGLTVSGGGSSPVTYGTFEGGGTLTTGSTATTITLTAGSWTFSGTNTGTGLEVRFTSATDQTVQGVPGAGSMNVDKSSGQLKLGGNVSIGSFTLTAGTVNPNAFKLTAGSFSVLGGTVIVDDATFSNNYSSFPGSPAAGSTYEYTAPTPAINGSITYRNLTFSGSGTTANPTADLTIKGNLANTGTGVLDFGARTVTISDTGASPSIAGFATTGGVTISKTAGTATLTGNLLAASLTMNGAGGTLNLGTGRSHQINGTVTFTNGTMNGGSSTLALTGNFTGDGGTFTASTGSVNFGGSGGTFTASTGSENFNGPAGQTIDRNVAIAFNNLTINNTAGVANNHATGGTSVNGTLTLTAGTFTLATALSLGNGVTIVRDGGSFSGTPTFGASANLTYSGATGVVAGSEIPTSTTVLNNMTINKSGGVTLGANATVNGILTLTSGNVTTGADTIFAGPGGSISRTSGHVVGNLGLDFTTGDDAAKTFHIGTATAYTPATLDVDGTGGTAGTIIASTTGSAHTDISNSGLDQTKDIERYWTLTAGTANLGVARTYKLKVDFLSGDVGGANTNNFEIRRRDGTGTWSAPTGGSYARTGTSTQYSSFASFSAFAVGEPAITAAPAVNSPIIAGATSVSGTSTEVNGTIIQVYVNNSAAGTTTTVTGGVWTRTGLAGLIAGDLVKARATASGKLASAFSNEVTVSVLTAIYVSTSGNDTTGDGTVTKPFRTIGKGVTTAVAGDTVFVLAGTYTGPINVDKSLFLIGSGAGTTIIEAPTGFAASSPTAYDYVLANFTTERAIVHIGTTTPITVLMRGFTVDGKTLGPPHAANVAYSGILAEQCNVTIVSNTVKNILPADGVSIRDPGGLYNGRGIHVRGSGAVATIDTNSLEEINRIHILVNSTDNNGSLPAVFPTASVNKNTILGKGASGAGQKGIWFNTGAWGTISGNTITNMDFTASAIEPDRASAIVVRYGYLDPAHRRIIKDNIITASSFTNNKGIYVQGIGDSVADNSITGFRWGIEVHDGNRVKAVRNTITGGTIGVLITTEHQPPFGAITPDTVTVGGSPADKNVITGQPASSAGGFAISLSFRDPLDDVTFLSPVPVDARYNDFGVYTENAVRDRIWDRADTSTIGGSLVDTVLYYPFYGMTVAKIKALLQGPYAALGDSMRTSLGASIPKKHPYGVAPWNYTGTDSVLAVPAGVVDWVLLTLRSDTLASTGVDTLAVFIKKDGSVVDLDGTSPVAFPSVAGGAYYVVLRHRNHLAVMTSTARTLGGNSALYDFTTAVTQAYGSDAMKGLGTGNTAPFALYGADGDGDGQIISTDFNVFNPKFTSGATGYQMSDWDLDGQVTSTDFNVFNPNFTTGKATRVP